MAWKLAKWVVWVVGFATLILCFNKMDFGTLANWIQYLSGFGMVYGLGLFIENVMPHFKHLKDIPNIHQMVKELHELHIGGKDDGTK